MEMITNEINLVYVINYGCNGERRTGVTLLKQSKLIPRFCIFARIRLIAMADRSFALISGGNYASNFI